MRFPFIDQIGKNAFEMLETNIQPDFKGKYLFCSYCKGFDGALGISERHSLKKCHEGEKCKF